MVMDLAKTPFVVALAHQENVFVRVIVYTLKEAAVVLQSLVENEKKKLTQQKWRN
jgi:hypothetical protein